MNNNPTNPQDNSCPMGQAMCGLIDCNCRTITNPQDNVHKSVNDPALKRIELATEIIKEASDLLVSADSTYTSWDKQHNSVQQLILGAMLDFSNTENIPLKDRIAELESENQKYREALEGVLSMTSPYQGPFDIRKIAEQALKK